MRLFLLGLALSVPLCAENFYISNAGGSVTCNGGTQSSQSPSYFNTSGNWANPKVSGKIGPDDTVYFCGTITFPILSAPALTAQASGNSGHPITLLFDTGSILQAPYFYNGGSTGGGAINLVGKSYIVLSGGSVPCGTTQGGVNSGNSCNGTIQNTANGSAAGGYANQAASTLIMVQNSTGVEIKNLLMQNVYVRTSTLDIALPNTDANCVVGTPATNLLIHDSVCNQSSWAFMLAGTGWQFYNNQISNYDHGIALGLGNVNTTNVLIHDNHFCCMSTWDDTSGSNAYHHDGIHAFLGGSEVDSTIYIYNNQFDGNAGAPNQWIYNEGAMSNPTYIFNNVMLSSNPSTSFPDEVNLSTTGNFYWNNTATGGNPSGNGGTISINGTSMSAFNNIFEGSQYTMALKSPQSSSTLASCGTGTGLDYNVYGTSSGTNTFGYPTGGTNSLSTWSAALLGGCFDAHSQVGTSAQVNVNASTGYLQTGSIAIGAGQNLTSLCSGNLAPLCSDKAGVSRPSVGSWDDGAYQYQAPPVGSVFGGNLTIGGKASAQ